MRKSKFWLSLTAGFMAAVLLFGMIPCTVSTPVSAASSSEIRNQIKELKAEKEEIEAQLKEIQSKYDANEGEILDLVSQKDAIDQEIALLHDQVENINDQLSAYALLIADKQDELDLAQTRLADLQEKHKARIRAMEEEGKLSSWSIIFRANSFSDLLDRLNMIQEINAADQKRLEEMDAAAQIVIAAREELEGEKAELEIAREELDATELILEEKRLEADEVLLELIAKGKEFEEMIDESEDLQSELMKEIAQAEKDLKKAEYEEWLATYVPPTTKPPSVSTQPSTQAPSSSGWVKPLKSYTLTSPFGMRIHPISGKEKMHEGVDMSAPQGTPIYAAKSGKVSRTSYQAGGAGYYVSINHGDGFSSIYMHMTHYIVSAGQYVNAGQVIGYVGSTGGSTGPHLHFGIAYNGTYVNPMKYI